MGGDEFAILCDGIDTRDGADALGDEIQAIFATPFVVHSLEHPLNQRLRLCALSLVRRRAERTGAFG